MRIPKYQIDTLAKSQSASTVVPKCQIGTLEMCLYHIYGRTTDAQKTIEILNLDCSTIVHRRKAAFEAYSSLDSESDIEWASEIARLKGRNKDNQYEEYCFAVIYFIEHYLAI